MPEYGLIPPVTEEELIRALTEAMARYFKEIEAESGSLTDGTRDLVCPVFSAAFCDGYAFASARLFEWVKRVPLIPVNYGPPPTPGRTG